MAMAQVTTILYLVTTLLLGVTFAFEFNENKTYAIQNTLQKTYLMAISNGRFCKKLGDVITTEYFDRKSKAFGWKYEALQDDNGTTDGRVSFKAGDDEYRNNELTNADFPPYCLRVYAEYMLNNTGGDAYNIMSIITDKCLASVGKEQRISWEDCQTEVGENSSSSNQLWRFIELEEERQEEQTGGDNSTSFISTNELS